jgi:hypothetical protein
VSAANRPTTPQDDAPGRASSPAALNQTASEVLNYVLDRAAYAHHFHELAIGGPHADWAPWYATHMAQTLADHGYRIILAPGQDGIDFTADPKEGVAEEASNRRPAGKSH